MYFAVSVPLILLVFVVAFLVQLGYDDNAIWSIATFKKAAKMGRLGTGNAMEKKRPPRLKQKN